LGDEKLGGAILAVSASLPGDREQKILKIETERPKVSEDSKRKKNVLSESLPSG
jgi:hypothetical protein